MIMDLVIYNGDLEVLLGHLFNYRYQKSVDLIRFDGQVDFHQENIVCYGLGKEGDPLRDKNIPCFDDLLSLWNFLFPQICCSPLCLYFHYKEDPAVYNLLSRYGENSKKVLYHADLFYYLMEPKIFSQIIKEKTTEYCLQDLEHQYHIIHYLYQGSLEENEIADYYVIVSHDEQNMEVTFEIKKNDSAYRTKDIMNGLDEWKIDEDKIRLAYHSFYLPHNLIIRNDILLMMRDYLSGELNLRGEKIPCILWRIHDLESYMGEKVIYLFKRKFRHFQFLVFEKISIDKRQSTVYHYTVYYNEYFLKGLECVTSLPSLIFSTGEKYIQFEAEGEIFKLFK